MEGIDIRTFKGKAVKQENTASSRGILDFLNKDIRLFGRGLPDKKKEAFYHELGILLNAGVDIKSALELITSEQKKAGDKALFGKTKDFILQGGTLSEALKDSGSFSAYEYYSLQIGEETGKIAVVLEDLATYYRKKVKQRRQIISAVSYPLIVLCTSLGAIFFMMNFIVPMFADIFKRFGGDLPFLTRLIVSASNTFREYFFLFFLLMLAIIFMAYLQRKKDWFRKGTAELLIKMPLVGEMVRKIHLARFCHSMALLIGARVPILRAINLTRQMISFYPIQDSLGKMEADISAGAPFYQTLARFPVYDRKMISLIKVGEEVNQLEVFFDKVASQYADDVEHTSSLLSSLMEPFIIIFLGVFVGVILIAMYLPLFQLGSSF